MKFNLERSWYLGKQLLVTKWQARVQTMICAMHKYISQAWRWFSDLIIADKRKTNIFEYNKIK